MSLEQKLSAVRWMLGKALEKADAAETDGWAEHGPIGEAERWRAETLQIVVLFLEGTIDVTECERRMFEELEMNRRIP